MIAFAEASVLETGWTRNDGPKRHKDSRCSRYEAVDGEPHLRKSESEHSDHDSNFRDEERDE